LLGNNYLTYFRVSQGHASYLIIHQAALRTQHASVCTLHVQFPTCSLIHFTFSCKQRATQGITASAALVRFKHIQKRNICTDAGSCRGSTTLRRDCRLVLLLASHQQHLLQTLAMMLLLHQSTDFMRASSSASLVAWTTTRHDFSSISRSNLPPQPGGCPF
jgi:hypothetical protein